MRKASLALLCTGEKWICKVHWTFFKSPTKHFFTVTKLFAFILCIANCPKWDSARRGFVTCCSRSHFGVISFWPAVERQQLAESDKICCIGNDPQTKKYDLYIYARHIHACMRACYSCTCTSRYSSSSRYESSISSVCSFLAPAFANI